MKILAYPRDRNPYQGLLYGACARHGVRVRYIGELTPSQTLNVLLLPFELALWRTRGWRALHLHWVFGFAPPWTGRVPGARRVMQLWFRLVLGVARVLDIAVVWTAHNTLPHERVFHDDLAARRTLIGASRLVVAHSPEALTELERIGAAPARAEVIPPGPFGPVVDRASVNPPAPRRGEPRRFLFFGKVIAYKGVEELLAAAARLPADLAAEIAVVGECVDDDLRESLDVLAAGAGARVSLRLVRVPDEEISRLMSEADAVVLPFRRVTSSSSASLAMEHARPVVVPDLPALRELPDEAVERYDGSVEGLSDALTRVAEWSPERLANAGAAARAYVDRFSWIDAADKTLSALEDVR
jgi:glycosyltransferase involved in cell wall biosynthesis